MGNQIALTNVVNISVSQANLGVGSYNTSNLALFTREVPNDGFDDGFEAFVTPDDVATLFGSSSDTYKMALAVFSQQPNILTGDGQLIIILFADTVDQIAVQSIDFSTVPASGAWKLKYGLLETGALAFNDDAAAVQVALRLLAGLGSVTVTGNYAAGFVVTFTGVSGPATLLVNSADSLQDSGNQDVFLLIVTIVPGTVDSTETLATAVTRTVGLVQYFGELAAEVTSGADTAAAAAVVQALNKMAFFMSRTGADIDPGGTLDDLRTGDFTKSRGLYYGIDNDTDLLIMAASYASRALSTDFSGSNTTQTMHLKTLSGVLPDPTMTQTILNKALTAGADTYISLQGDSAVFTSGENGGFFDQVYNLQWLVGALQVAGYNYLAAASTKIPQTEPGMDGLKGAYRAVLEQGVTNGYSAPGTWNSPTTFGNPANLLANVRQVGYYIFSSPIATQLQVDRVDRKAPLVQIALKEAGAIQESNVIVNVNP